ncbi:MAG TPA: NRDE family protein [Stellaceae bacterium]|nr:NRDE family protein [Stellaceae bacterium]
MCTLVILRRPGHDWPLLLAANRDEMIQRPWQSPARHWPDRPEVVAGRDELAGGSWLGVNDFGVAAAVLNRFGTLGPAPGQRSRGELVLEALDHADARAAAAALAALEPNAYRTFNLIVADNRDAYWLRHADPSGTLPVSSLPIAAGLSMIAAGDLDDDETPRLKRYRPLFAAAAAPDPERGDWTAWERLLLDDGRDSREGTASAMRFITERGFGTVSSALIALPAIGRGDLAPRFRFASHHPESEPWRDISM